MCIKWRIFVTFIILITSKQRMLRYTLPFSMQDIASVKAANALKSVYGTEYTCGPSARTLCELVNFIVIRTQLIRFFNSAHCRHTCKCFNPTANIWYTRWIEGNGIRTRDRWVKWHGWRERVAYITRRHVYTKTKNNVKTVSRKDWECKGRGRRLKGRFRRYYEKEGKD